MYRVLTASFIKKNLCKDQKKIFLKRKTDLFWKQLVKSFTALLEYNAIVDSLSNLKVFVFLSDLNLLH